jgi:hypothetical protein
MTVTTLTNTLLSLHCTQIFSLRTLCVYIAAKVLRLHCSFTVRLICKSVKFEWTSVLLRLLRVSDCSLYFQIKPKLISPKSQPLNSFCDWWSRMSPWLRKCPQDITFFSVGSLSPSLTYSVSAAGSRSCVYHNTLLIDTNTTKSLHLNCTLMDLIS